MSELRTSTRYDTGDCVEGIIRVLAQKSRTCDNYQCNQCSTGASLEMGQCRCLHHQHLSRFYLKAEESENGLDLQYCNGQKRYDFSIYAVGCELM